MPLSVYIVVSAKMTQLERLFLAHLECRLPQVRVLGLEHCMPQEKDKSLADWELDSVHDDIYAARCEACGFVDAVIYLGDGDINSGLQIGLAAAAGVPVIGVRGMEENPGVMLSRMVTLWCHNESRVVDVLEKLSLEYCDTDTCPHCIARLVCTKSKEVI